MGAIPYKNLTFAYNTNHRTSYSHFLLFGRQSRLPIDITFNFKSNNFQKETYHSYVKNWQKALSNAHKIVNQNINKGNNNNKALHDKKVYDQNFVVGDRVHVKNVSLRQWNLKSNICT